VPLALHRITRRVDVRRGVETALGTAPSLALGVAMVGLAILVVTPIAPTAGAPTQEALSLALSVVLLGLLVMTTRRTALTIVIGFLSLENGLALAATGVAGVPLVLELTAALLVLAAMLVAGIALLHVHDRLGGLSLTGLDRLTRQAGR
jgi:hydrogenase-4 component E